MRPANPDDPRLIWAPRKLDPGVDEEARLGTRRNPYRDDDQVLAVIRGHLKKWPSEKVAGTFQKRSR